MAKVFRRPLMRDLRRVARCLRTSASCFFNAVIFVRLNGGRFPTGFRPALSSRYRPFGFANVHNRAPAVRSNGSTEPAPPATYLPAIGRVWQKSPKSNPLCRVRGIELFFQITLLCRREFVVKHDQPDIMLLDHCRQLFRLARTDKQSRMRFVAA